MKLIIQGSAAEYARIENELSRWLRTHIPDAELQLIMDETETSTDAEQREASQSPNALQERLTRRDPYSEQGWEKTRITKPESPKEPRVEATTDSPIPTRSVITTSPRPLNSLKNRKRSFPRAH